MDQMRETLARAEAQLIQIIADVNAARQVMHDAADEAARAEAERRWTRLQWTRTHARNEVIRLRSEIRKAEQQRLPTAAG